jgi:hypothetical protein
VTHTVMEGAAVAAYEAANTAFDGAAAATHEAVCSGNDETAAAVREESTAFVTLGPVHLNASPTSQEPSLGDEDFLGSASGPVGPTGSASQAPPPSPPDPPAHRWPRKPCSFR